MNPPDKSRIILLTICLALLAITTVTPYNVFSTIDWIKPDVYVKYYKSVDFIVLDNQTLSLSPKLRVLNYSTCFEESKYNVITYSELSFVMVKERLNTSINNNPFCSYLEIIDEGSRATSTTESGIALVFSWYTIPSFQFKLVDREGYMLPWYSGVYIFFTPTYIKEMGNEFSDHVQRILDSRYYGLDTMIDAALKVKYNAHIGFIDNLVYSVTIYFRLTNETNYIPVLNVILSIAFVDTNIPIERIELMERIKIPLIITGVSIAIIIAIVILRTKLRKFLR